MERSSAADYSGLPSPLPSNLGDHSLKPESILSDHSTAHHQPYTTQSEVRQNNYSTTATPTSEYSGYPASARSGSFPDHTMQRYHHTATGMSGTSMAQANSPSQSLPDGRAHQAPQIDTTQMKSDPDVPIDPSISGASPTQYGYPQSPYATVPAQDMSAHSYAHAGGYAQSRPDWSGYSSHPAPITPNHHVFPQTPTTASQTRPNQVRCNLASIICSIHISLSISPPSSYQMVSRAIPSLTNTIARRSTVLCLFLARSSTSALVADMRKSSACTSAAGTVVRRPTVLSIT